MIFNFKNSSEIDKNELTEMQFVFYTCIYSKNYKEFEAEIEKYFSSSSFEKENHIMEAICIVEQFRSATLFYKHIGRCLHSSTQSFHENILPLLNNKEAINFSFFHKDDQLVLEKLNHFLWYNISNGK